MAWLLILSIYLFFKTKAEYILNFFTTFCLLLQFFSQMKKLCLYCPEEIESTAWNELEPNKNNFECLKINSKKKQ